MSKIWISYDEKLHMKVTQIKFSLQESISFPVLECLQNECLKDT